MSDSWRDEIVRTGWTAGISVRELGRKVGRSPGWVSLRASRLGLPPRSPRFTAREAAASVRCYREGQSITAIARRLGRDPATVRKALVSAGIDVISGADRARRWPVHHDAFDHPLSSEGWYWIGFLAADGCVIGTQITLGLSPASRAALIRFLAFVGCPARPLRSTAGGKQLAATVHSKQMTVALGRHGVVSRKSHSMTASVEAANEPGFWLGVLDGDGSVVIGANGVPRIQFAGSKPLIAQCAGFIGDAIGRRPAIYRARPSPVLWRLAVSGDAARRLALVLLGAHDRSLEAKRAKLELAAAYQSRVTRARGAVRRRRCAYCGAWVERYPSQVAKPHVFCSRSHSAKWRAARDKLPTPRQGDNRQLQFAAPGL